MDLCKDDDVKEHLFVFFFPNVVGERRGGRPLHSFINDKNLYALLSSSSIFSMGVFCDRIKTTRFF